MIYLFVNIVEIVPSLKREALRMPGILALERPRSGPRIFIRSASHSFRTDFANLRHFQPAFTSQLSHASQRGWDAEARQYVGNRGRDLRLALPFMTRSWLRRPQMKSMNTWPRCKRWWRRRARRFWAGSGSVPHVKTMRFSDRYMDARGERMWHTVMRLLPHADSGHGGTPQSSWGVPWWYTPCPAVSHPLRIIIYVYCK